MLEAALIGKSACTLMKESAVLLQMLFKRRMRRLIALFSPLLTSLLSVVLAALFATALWGTVRCRWAPFGF